MNTNSFLQMMLKLLIFCLFALSVFAETDPDETSDLFHLVHSRGYILQAHDVTTQDGYVVLLSRQLNHSKL